MKFSRQHRFSERSILLEWPKEPLMEANASVDDLFFFLKNNASDDLENLFPAYHSLLIVCRKVSGVEKLNGLIHEFYKHPDQVRVARTAKKKAIPVCYDPALGNDLAFMSAHLSLTPDEIIRIHLSATYHVFMLGFLPGFAYMGMVDEKIAMPRKESPVPTKSGAVGIAGRQTGIYPCNSPGGWHILGYTPLQMFDATKENPSLLEPGDEVCFEPVDLKTFQKMITHEF